MLKLEKTSNFSGLTIRMREQERFFEPRVLKALAIAIILHMGTLLLFDVTPFYLSSTFTFSPIQVQSEPPPQGVSALVSSYMEEDELSHLPLPIIPALDWIFFSQESILTPSLAFDIYALQSLEDRLWPKWEEPLSIKLEEPGIQLVISGDLAQIPLLTIDPLLNQMQPISFHEASAYATATYQVLLDEKTGELFWYERTESSTIPTIDQLTESILLNLRFVSAEMKAPVEGALHFFVTSKDLAVP